MHRLDTKTVAFGTIHDHDAGAFGEGGDGLASGGLTTDGLGHADMERMQSGMFYHLGAGVSGSCFRQPVPQGILPGLARLAGPSGCPYDVPACREVTRR
jgi:hypothetical protein